MHHLYEGKKSYDHLISLFELMPVADAPLASPRRPFGGGWPGDNHVTQLVPEPWSTSARSVSHNNSQHPDEGAGATNDRVMRIWCSVNGRTVSLTVRDEYRPVSWLIDAFSQRFDQNLVRVLLGGKEIPARTRIGDVLRDGDCLQGEVGRSHQDVRELSRAVSIRDRYREIKRFKGGSMGIVFKAHDTASTGLYREVVVKLLRSGASVERQERFKREARIIGGLNHPNIITYLDMGHEPDGTLFLVMESVDGPDLQQVLDRRGHLDEEDTVAVAIRVASALHCTHAHGIVHRDLKPANIVVIMEAMIVKVIDFGLARELGGGSLLTGENVVGTPMYFAPEQTISGAEISTATDIWAVGVLVS